VSVLKVAPEVEDVIEAKNKALEARGSKVVALSDVSESIQKQVDEVVGGAIGTRVGDGPLANLGYILGGIWLIMIAMLLFVSWRAAVIAALAVPLSLLFTLLALWVQGVTLNTLTLFSMILVLGLIVDPAIVVLEAIQRQLDMGLRGRAAVITAINSVGSGVFYAVLTSIIVFVPFGVVSGIFGQIIKYIPITVIPALLASYLIPMLFLTFLAQRFLKPAKKAMDDEEVANLWKSSQWFIKTNTKILNRRWLQVVIILLAVVVPLGVSGALFATGKISPVQFSSPHDTEDITVKVEFPQNSTDDYKRLMVGRLEEYLVGRKEIFTYFSQEQTEKSLLFYVRLVPRKLRATDSPEIVESINNDFAVLSKTYPGLYYTANTANVGTPQADFPVAVNIYGDDMEALKKAAIKTGEILKEQPHVTRVEDGYTGTSNPQIAITLNRDELSKHGLPAVAVAGALNGILGQVSVTKMEYGIDGAERTSEVILTNAAKPSSVDAIKDVVIGASAQGFIKVGDVATVDQVNGVSTIQRLNGSRFVTVQAKVIDPLKDAAAPQAKVREFWTKDHLAEYGLRPDALEGKGSGDEFVKSFKDLFIALGIAILMLYVALVVFLKSFSQPFIILFAVPLTFVGVFPALTLAGGQFGFLEILGIITLSGIVVNVGIFVLDQANQKRAEGVPLKQAIAEATGIRFRPIFLTKVTALAGLLPLILFSPFWRSLATVVVAGVLVSGFLSLFTTPILYVWFAHLKERLVRGFSRVTNR
jgi:HAE1 family hydrophobic/amphiphilic exporter-1